MKKKMLYTISQVNEKFHDTAEKALKKKFARRFDSKFYSTLEKSNSRFAEFLRSSSTTGKCYVFALLLSQFIPDCTLVHGVLENLNRSVDDAYIEVFEHAWVEYKNLVFDTNLKCCFDKNAYYKLYDVKVSQKFSKEDLKDENTLVKLAKNSLKIYKEMKEPLCSFSPFKDQQEKINFEK